MDGFNTDKKYESFKIPGRQQVQGSGGAKGLPQAKAGEAISFDEGLFYEIEYDSGPMPGVGKFVLKPQKKEEPQKIEEFRRAAEPQKIEEPKKDEKRELFNQMREIARAYRSNYDYTRFFDRRVQHDNAIIFYKQGMFMKDFSDDYSGNAPFSQYFPTYQMMGYDQLRIYFTWRTEVRKGNVAEISISYAFLYIYELLGNIGVSGPQDGLNQLMAFWRAFRDYNKAMDKYVLRWLKDYHIYYELPHSFKEFIDANNLTEHYPKMTDIDDNFDLFCTISKYDIRKSNFFADDNGKLIKDCFSFVTNKLRQVFEENGIRFDDAVFQPTKKMSEWKPFKDAVFHQWMKQADRRIVLAENEIYLCSNNKWAFNTAITSESGRQLIGYIMKQMEVALRKVTKFKFKLSANIKTVTNKAVDKLKEKGLSLETIINSAVAEFYKEATKTVVTVDLEALFRIKQEALAIQEKLIVPEQEKPFIPVQEQLDLFHMAMQDMPSMRPLETESTPWGPLETEPTSKLPHETNSTPVYDAWEGLKNILTKVEIGALSVVLNGGMELKKYADECGIMQEVLVDGINEKAMDLIGDSLLDEEFSLYNDYKEQVKELIK
ncbi:hypothetical protein HNQ56_004369 [Anaerotaenia torta]|uniref:TerB N-terminal domain-containing protein n=1 Tax=Anaerotaenia torta TaxID=433293 RepID=UPI003D22DE85